MSKSAELVPVEVKLPTPTVHSEVNAVLGMIERASKDPASDVDKLQKLFELRDRVRQQVARDVFVEQLTLVQQKLPVIRMKGRIDYGKGSALKYAKWEDIYEAIMPILNEHGFTLTFEFGASEANITVTALLDHVAGHTRLNMATLPKDNSGGKSSVQGVGSSYSYGKRYATAGVLNLTWGGEDDDGNGGRGAPISPAELADLIGLVEDAGTSPDKLAMRMGVETLEELPVAKLGAAKAALAAKLKGKA